jgi:hypothetical protein
VAGSSHDHQSELVSYHQASFALLLAIAHETGVLAVLQSNAKCTENIHEAHSKLMV